MGSTMKVSELAEALGCTLYGPGERDITGVSGLEQAGPDHLTFLSNAKYIPKVSETRAGAILLSKPMDGIVPACLVSANPYLDFARALAFFYQAPRPAPGNSSHRGDRRIRAGGRRRFHWSVLRRRRTRDHRPRCDSASACGDL